MTEDIFILDCYSDIYVWVGQQVESKNKLNALDIGEGRRVRDGRKQGIWEPGGGFVDFCVLPGIVMDGIHGVINEVNENGTSAHHEENPVGNNSANGGLTSQCPPNGDMGHAVDGVVETSIEQLYENVCEMRSSDQSPSRPSFGSDGEESRIDSELCHLVGGEMAEVEIIEEDEEVQNPENGGYHSDSGSKKESLAVGKLDNSQPASTSTPSAKSRKAYLLQVESEVSAKSSPKSRNPEKPPRSENNGGKNNCWSYLLKKVQEFSFGEFEITKWN
ncbi:protein KINESIN LIGHT CHAIN-RELATED 3-like [Forsythia ovata]|uniref:Protein KINESIN LIGHT CHAIN-RELATED 3-like n=1 Tax=Forsythia ovata TaxID=205694 RepID=A0ABD1TSP3_9LAMI